MNDLVNILAIETSCDDTAAAVVQNNKVLSNIVSSQKIHELYGGVVPEVASREHDKLIVPVIRKALTSSGLSLNQIDAVAYTRGPGLMGSLLVGTSFAKSLSLSLNIPLLEINHMHAHILSIFIDDGKDVPTFPFLALTVSGGHTQLVIVNSASDFNLIGTTLDDAAGEAFDKSGKLLGFEYPAGPKIDEIAKDGDPNKFKFTKPNVAGLDFSFSGLKTNILIQEYIKESKGTDIRAFIVDGEIVGAMERKGKEGEFRSNLHRGGKGSIIELTKKEQSAALKAAKSLGLSVAGVDMLRSSRGPLIVEVNSSPGLEGIERATGVDIADKIIAYIEKNVSKQRRNIRSKG